MYNNTYIDIYIYIYILYLVGDHSVYMSLKVCVGIQLRIFITQIL